MALLLTFLASLILLLFVPCIEALGPVKVDVQRPDGLCASLVNPVGGYSCREYMVQTDDQFFLGVQRVSRTAYAGMLKGPVLLLHGILLGGDVWFLNPPEQSLAFLLADQGFDVWIGNTRTTRFSYGHPIYHKKDEGFWDWSVDELAQYDLPAMMGLVRSQTNQKVHYIGFSQGSQQALAAFSEGNLLDMVDKVVYLAPVAFVNNVSTAIGNVAARFYIDRLFQVSRVFEFSTQYRSREFVDIICTENAAGCFNKFLTLFTGNNCCLNYSRRAFIDAYETQPTATKNLVHLAQQSRSKTFTKYNYGFFGNLKRYGQSSPPAYDLSKVKVPSSNTIVFYGGGDALSDPTDMAFLLSLLPNKGTYPVTLLPSYAHLDFILGINANQLVYKPIIDFLSS